MSYENGKRKLSDSRIPRFILAFAQWLIAAFVALTVAGQQRPCRNYEIGNGQNGNPLSAFIIHPFYVTSFPCIRLRLLKNYPKFLLQNFDITFSAETRWELSPSFLRVYYRGALEKNASG